MAFIGMALSLLAGLVDWPLERVWFRNRSLSNLVAHACRLINMDQVSQAGQWLPGFNSRRLGLITPKT
jgi:hypothetical protein